MKTLFDLSGQFCWLLSVIARALIGFLVLIVVADVAVRNMGLRPLSWAVNSSEILLLYVTFFSMPWLVRKKGHVSVNFLRVLLPETGRYLLSKAVYIGCMLLCIYLGWIALTSMQLAISRGAYEMRNFDIPKWVIFAPMALALFMAALEWLRYALGVDNYYNADPLENGGH